MKSDLSPVPFPNGKGCLLAKVNVLRELQSPALHFGDAPQSASGEELRPFFGPLRALTSSPSEASWMPSILDKSFKGEL